MSQLSVAPVLLAVTPSGPLAVVVSSGVRGLAATTPTEMLRA